MKRLSFSKGKPFFLSIFTKFSFNYFKLIRKNIEWLLVVDFIFISEGELEMFKVQEIREIIKLVDASSIDEFVYEVDGAKVKLKKNNVVVTETVAPKKEVVAPVVQQTAPVEAPAAPAPAKVEEAPAAPATNDPSLHKVVSPMVGTFYQAPNPDSPAYVKVGDKVGNETIVCIVEAMKLFNEIEAEVQGEIVEVLVKDGELVEYGQPLFLVKAE